jgi:hypothetical protein
MSAALLRAFAIAVLSSTLACESGKSPPARDISPAIADLPAQGGSCHAVHDDPATHQSGKWTVYVFDLASPTRRVTFTLRADGIPQSFRAFAVIPATGSEVRVMAAFSSRGEVLDGSEAITALPATGPTRVMNLDASGRKKVQQLIQDVVKRCTVMPGVL